MSTYFSGCLHFTRLVVFATFDVDSFYIFGKLGLQMFER